MRGEIEYAATMVEICRRQNAQPDPAVLSALQQERMVLKAKAMHKIDSRVIRMIQGLGTNGVKLTLVSNGDALEVDGWSLRFFVSGRRHET
ncbi:MAG: hypothetical protein CMQ05_18730 [Gammaproteobacteria bacterium]|nr:hypothetical protein [Gammaproteobacteria bacterium]RPG23772.1 MAG: hypothetical protein CBC10_013975 [Gammaproteobacteria bacterium TMED50]|tara:strand:+ start:1246 stop:1518 length:273 start_codon:yes stop_codon:yes gene_type:complete